MNNTGTSATQLLSYEPSKAIIKYLHTDLRTKLWLRCPHLKTTERSVPLKIQKVDFGNDYICTDSTKYAIKLHRVPKPGVTNRHYEDVEYDVDECGFQTDADSWTQKPGDILVGHEKKKMRRIEEVDAERRSDQSKRELEEKIEYYEKKIRNGEIQSNDDNLFGWGTTYAEKLNILKIQHDAHICHREKTSPSYDAYIQLSINGVWQKSQLVKYDRPLSNAMKALIKLLFGGRRDPIIVQFAETSNSRVIRLPKRVKFKIHNFEASCHIGRLQRALSRILDPSSYPFCTLYFNPPLDSLKFADFEHPIVRDAKTVIIWSDDYFDPFLDFVTWTKHKQIGYSMSESVLETFLFTMVIDDWVQDGREVGSWFDMRHYELEKVTALFNALKENYADAVVNNQIKLPMVDNNVLTVIIFEFPPDMHENMYSVRIESTPNDAIDDTN